jgi:hypothetical protein
MSTLALSELVNYTAECPTNRVICDRYDNTIMQSEWTDEKGTDNGL